MVDNCRCEMKINELLTESELAYTTKTSPHYRTKQPNFVMGKEVENTPAFGKKSLFITDVSDYKVIEQMAQDKDIKQLYFEFIWAIDNNPKKIPQVIQEFRKALKYFLGKGYLCGLDTPSQYAEDFADLHKHKNLINNIAIDIPKLDKYNDNTVIKLRDGKFGGSNGGVYVIPLNKIMTDKNFTSWADFGPDVEVIPKEKS